MHWWRGRAGRQFYRFVDAVRILSALMRKGCSRNPCLLRQPCKNDMSFKYVNGTSTAAGACDGILPAFACAFRLDLVFQQMHHEPLKLQPDRFSLRSCQTLNLLRHIFQLNFIQAAGTERRGLLIRPSSEVGLILRLGGRAHVFRVSPFIAWDNEGPWNRPLSLPIPSELPCWVWAMWAV